jgi:hypothetical protein
MNITQPSVFNANCGAFAFRATRVADGGLVIGGWWLVLVAGAGVASGEWRVKQNEVFIGIPTTTHQPPFTIHLLSVSNPAEARQKECIHRLTPTHDEAEIRRPYSESAPIEGHGVSGRGKVDAEGAQISTPQHEGVGAGDQ